MPSPASYNPPGNRSGHGAASVLHYLMEDLRRKPLEGRPRVLQASDAHSMIIGPVMERGGPLKNELKPGSKVILAGLRHELTVRVVAGGFAYCEWTDGGELKQGTFDLASLSPAPAAQQDDKTPFTR